MIHSFPRNTGLIGLMLAAILAAAMSTLSSSLSASASSVVSDLWLPNCQSAPSQRWQVWVTRWLTVGFGGLQIAIGIWASTFDESVVTNALTIAGFSSGILLGLFALGVFTRRTNQAAALGSGAIGLLALLMIQFALPIWGYKVAFPWLPVFGATITYSAGLILSLFVTPPLTITKS